MGKFYNKNLMHKNRKLYSEWNSNGRQPARRDRVKQHQSKTEKAIIDAKNLYFENLSNKICDPTTGQKTFWSAYKRLSNKQKRLQISHHYSTIISILPTLRKKPQFSTNILLLNANPSTLNQPCQLSHHSLVIQYLMLISL